MAGWSPEALLEDKHGVAAEAHTHTYRHTPGMYHQLITAARIMRLSMRCLMHPCSTSIDVSNPFLHSSCALKRARMSAQTRNLTRRCCACLPISGEYRLSLCVLVWTGSRQFLWSVTDVYTHMRAHAHIVECCMPYTHICTTTAAVTHTGWCLTDRIAPQAVDCCCS